MVLSRIREEKRTVRHRSNPVAKYVTEDHTVKTEATFESFLNEQSTRSTSLTTSAIANEALSASTIHSNVTTTLIDDTLSMISTPWSTETWKSQPESAASYSTTYLCWNNSNISSFSSLTIEPRTTTTCGIPSWPSLSTKTGSDLTPVLANDVVLSAPVSRCVKSSKRLNSGSTPTNTSWSLETYTSTGLISNFRDPLRVNYPWSPTTFMSSTDFTDNYPSSRTLISQKGSRETMIFGKRDVMNLMTPMNYIGLTKDDYPYLDWIQVKQKGILSNNE